MAATDGLAVPLRSQAFRLTAPIFDADGDLVTGMTGLDAVVSIDGATAFYTQNNPVEVATGIGLCYLDLAATEMAGNTIAGRIIVTNSGAKNTPFVLYTATAIGFDGLVNAIWATPIRALGTAGQTAVSQETTNAVWATPTRSLTDWVGIVNAVWATPSRITTSVASPVGVGSNFDKTSYTLTAAAATSIADSVLDRDLGAGVDSGSMTVRTVRQALRFLRNKWSISSTTLTVTKEDDSTTSWTSVLATAASADPVVGSDPAGP